MPRRYSGRSTTTARTTGSTETTQAKEAAVEQLESEMQEAVRAEDARVAEEAPKPKEPEVLSTGLVEGKWAGVQFWHCPRCGRDEFNRDVAEIHVCKGRIAKPYKGE